MTTEIHLRSPNFSLGVQDKSWTPESAILGWTTARPFWGGRPLGHFLGFPTGVLNFRYFEDFFVTQDL